MLWSRPVRAQRPIVSGVNRTFAASRIAAASVSVIQSAGEATYRSAFDDAFDEDDERDELDELALSLLGSLVAVVVAGSEDVDPASDLASFEPDVPSRSDLAALSADVDPLSPSLDDFDEPEEDARRSFFAHPDPLKWIAGVVNAFLIGPLPQSGHSVGGSAWTPRRTSNRWPQFAQS